MLNHLKPSILFAGIVSAIFLFFSINYVEAATICSYPGPDVSPDLLRLTNFTVSGVSNLKVGDTITVKFTLENYGQYDLNLGSKGIFAAARDPDNSDSSFGFSFANTVLEYGGIRTIKVTKYLDKAGTWKVWPSYHLSLASGEKFGPDEWHFCSFQVAPSIQDSDQDGVPDNQDNCPLKYNPQQEDIDGDGIGDVCDPCDDRDSDHDDIKNCLDQCPNEPENYNNYQDDDGCPDEKPVEVKDSDQDGVPDNQDNCPLKYNPQQEDTDGDGIGDVCDPCDDRDSDQDGIKNCLDQCPNEPENYNGFLDDDGCPDQELRRRDEIPPSVSIVHSPADVDFRTEITLTSVATDNNTVSRILIYLNNSVVKECSPPEYFERDNYWQCIYRGGPYPVGTLTYKAEAFDLENNKGTTTERTINVKGLELTPPSPGEEAQRRERVPCYISGKLLDFKYLSKTVQVKFCEAESIGGGCLSVPPFTCSSAYVSCKEGGRTWYIDVNRIWTGEETYRNPGPLSYQSQVSCEGTYLIQPVYKAFGEECEWQGIWRPTKSNFVTLSGTSKTDYDFRFTPQNLTPPNIQITKSEPSIRRASFDGEGEFYLNIKTVDSLDGVKSAKVSGNYRISYFQSNEAGPLERKKAEEIISVSQECGIYYQGSSRIPHASCRLDIPYYEGGKSITFDLRISACDTVGNKIETTYTHIFPEEVGDLVLLSAEPVQVVYGAPLIKNKNTAFRVKVNSSFPYPVETYFRLTLPSDKWWLTSGTGRHLLGFPPGWHFPDLWGPIKIPANARNYKVMLPIIADWQKELSSTGPEATRMLRGGEIGGIFGVDVRLMPVPIADSVNFSVEIDPNNEIREIAETGNRFDSPNYSVIKTRAWRFLIVPYEDEDGCAPYRPFVEAGVKRYLEYLLATYPIAEKKLEYAFAATPYSHGCTHDPSLTCEYVRTMNRGANELRQWTARLAESEGYDFGIAVGCGGGGQANFGVMAVTVGDSGGEWVLAHEFNHATAEMSDVYSYRAGEWEVPYCEFGDHYENCPEEYRGETACQEWCTPERMRYPEYCNGRRLRTWFGSISSACDLWARITRKPRNDCPDRIKNMINNEENYCRIWCEYDQCPSDKQKSTDSCGNEYEKSACESWCEEEGGQKTYVAPDRRNVLPASDGFWVNKWIPVSSQTSAYFMDSCIDHCHCVFPWMRKESMRYCVDNNQCGHRLPDGSIVWGDIGDARRAQNLDKDGYLNLLNNRRFKNAVDPEGLLVSGTINKDGTVKLDPFIYLSETFLDIEPGTDGDYYFVFFDKDNKVLSKSGFDVSFYQSDPHGGPIDEMGFVYRIEWREGIKRIELQDKDGKVLARRDVSENKPEVKVIYPNGGEVFTQGKKIKIKWQASDKDGDALTYSLSLSRDNGKTWLPIDVDIKNNEYELNSFSLEPGNYLIKIRATDGVNTGEDVSDRVFTIKLSKKIPAPYIIGSLILIAIVLAIIIYKSRFLKKKGLN